MSPGEPLSGPRRAVRRALGWPDARPRAASLFLFLAVLSSCARPDGRTLVFAAASLADVLQEVADAYVASPSGSAVDLNLAGSSELARQILAGAPADLFLSADRLQTERLLARGAAIAEACRPLLGNILVVIASPGAEPMDAPDDLLAYDRLALADPAGVPAGVYAREWLERVGLWERLQTRTVATLDVRAALAAVAAGDLPAGIVYETDAASSDRVSVIYRVVGEGAPHIGYYLCRLSDAPGALRFAAHLETPEVQELFRAHGFLPLAAEGSDQR